MSERRFPEDDTTLHDPSKDYPHLNKSEALDHTHRDHDGEEDGDSDTTSTNSSDEFDWDEEEVTSEVENPETGKKAMRGRALWLAFMKLARPVRTILVGALGAAFFIIPLLVVELKFKHEESVRLQIRVWSLWLSITWAAGCSTYMLVDAIPRTVIYIVFLLGGQVERLKTQIEVCVVLQIFGSLTECVVVVDACCLSMDKARTRYIMGLDSAICNHGHLPTSWRVLGCHRPCYAGMVFFQTLLTIAFHSISTGSLCSRYYPICGKVVPQICCHQLPPTCSCRSSRREPTGAEGTGPSIKRSIRSC